MISEVPASIREKIFSSPLFFYNYIDYFVDNYTTVVALSHRCGLFIADDDIAA